MGHAASQKLHANHEGMSEGMASGLTPTGQWEPTEHERRVIREALLKERPCLAENEQSLIEAEMRVVDWVCRIERENVQGSHE